MFLRSSSLVSVVSLLTAAVFVTPTYSAPSCKDEDPHPDKIHSLPGWNQPLPSAWYSGYLDYELEGRQIHTHYVLIRAEDDEDHTKPLIYWSNGGPGASSLFGLLTELGPLQLSDWSLDTPEYKATGIPTPYYNPYSWSRLGSLLIFDQPAPVGYSFCNDDDAKNASSRSCGGLSWTDELASQNVYLALQEFYQTHSCFQNVDLYLTGESYAGIYVPTLARRIVQDPKPTVKIPLKGFAVGDGCLGTQTDVCGGLANIGNLGVDFWHVIFMAGHHQMPLSTFHDLMKACNHRTSMDREVVQSGDDEACKKQVEKAKKELGGFFEYSLYDECTYRNGLLGEQGMPFSGARVSGGLNDYPCGGGAVMEGYLKLDAVKKAFKVRSDFFEVDNAVGFDYTPTEPDLTGFYKAINGKLKVLIYNGDTDPAITSFAAQNWTSHLGFEAEQPWRPWTVDSCQRMGGYVVRYTGMFDFLTIRGAGHMVPTYKPETTFTFLKAWMDGTDYPSFDPDCKQPSSRKHGAAPNRAMSPDKVETETNQNLGDENHEGSSMLRAQLL